MIMNPAPYFSSRRRRQRLWRRAPAISGVPMSMNRNRPAKAASVPDGKRSKTSRLIDAASPAAILSSKCRRQQVNSGAY